MEMLNAFVFLSIYGLITLVAISNAASTITKPIACAVPEPCPNATRSPLTSVYSRTTMMK